MANASGFRGSKQSNGYFVPLGNCVGKISTYVGGSGAGGSYLPGSFVVADWAPVAGGGNSAGNLLSSISSIGQGGLLKDMGKTVVSSNRTFRKVQLVAPNVTSAGVATSGSNASTTGPYLTGYIELATGTNVTQQGEANVAPVAYLPGAMM
jgi:hypothetical protein